jgi:hypothetical protein
MAPETRALRWFDRPSASTKLKPLFYDEKLAQVNESNSVRLAPTQATVQGPSPAIACPRRLSAGMMNWQSSYQNGTSEQRFDAFAMCNGFIRV